MVFTSSIAIFGPSWKTMRLFSLATVFCLVWETKVTDGRPAQNSYLTFINRGSKHDGGFLTSRNGKTATAEILDAYIHPKVPFMMWDDSSKRLHYTRTSVDNSQPSLISSRKNKEWDQLNVAVKRNTLLTSKLLDSIPRTNHFPYHRSRRNTNSIRSNGSVAMPNVNLASRQLGTVPGDIQTNGDAPSNSGSPVSLSDGNVHISETVDINTNGNLVTGTPLAVPLSAQVHRHENDSTLESSNLDGVNHNTPVNSEAGGSGHQEPSHIGGASGSEPGNTLEDNSHSEVLDHPSDVGIKDRVLIEPAGGLVSVNSSEGREHSNTNVDSAFANIHTNSHPANNVSNEELSSTDSNEVSRNGSDSNSVNEPSNHLNSNINSSSGALSPAVIIDNEKINQHTHPITEQDNATDIDKPNSNQNVSAAINPTNSIPGFMATSASTTIYPSLRNFDSSLIVTSNDLLSVTTRESVPALQTVQMLGSEITMHSVTPSTRRSEEAFSFSTQMLTVSHISRTFPRDITPSAGNVLGSEVTAQTRFIQPTVVVLPTLSTQDNIAPFNSVPYASPSTTPPKSDESGTGSTIYEQLQTSLPRRITALTLGSSIPSEARRVLIPQLQNINLTSTTQHVHVVAESPSSTVTLSTSRLLPAVTSVNGRAASRGMPIVVSVHNRNTSGLLAHPTGDPPPIINNRPDAPELVHPDTTDAQITESIPRHPVTEGNEVEEKMTETSSGASQETSEHQLAGGTSSYATTAATLKSTSSGNTANNETDSPPSYIVLKFGMSWRYFCQQEMTIRQELVDIIQVHVKSGGIAADQIQVMDRETVNCFQGQASDMAEIVVRMYLTNITHQFDRNLTLQCATILQAEIPFDEWKNSIIKTTLRAINVCDKDSEQAGETTCDDNRGGGDSITSDAATDHRVTIAIALAVVGGCCCIGLIILQVVVRRRNKDSSIPSINSSYSRRSSDSIQLASVIKSRPNSGLLNPGLDILEPPEPSHPLNYVQLSNFCMDEKKIAEEYQKLPQRMPRPSMVPAGDEDKNRYANIVPLVHTRVKLTQEGPGRKSSYINANYVTGPNNQCQYYIATQAPTENTTTDFWTMIWQQGCQTIVMLTDMEEQGQIKCNSYWPELVGKSAAHKYGDFLIELIRKDVNQEYIMSRLEINNQRKIETRQIDHFWYTCWPPHGLPEPISLVKLVLDVRPKYENGTSPLVVHCSPGTGRTCTFIALDLCMKQLETKRIVDVMKTVNLIRQERAGAIQNKEQYALLYNAVHEYAAIITTPGISATSSAATLQTLLSS